jgi:hypothetical protein
LPAGSRFAAGGSSSSDPCHFTGHRL